MTTTDYALLIAFLLSFGGLCWLAVAYWDERDRHDTTKAHHALIVGSKNASIKQQDIRIARAKRLNEDLTADLAKARSERDRVKQQAHILGHHIADTHWLPTIEGNRRRPVDIRAELVESAPVYEATEAHVPRLSSQAYAARLGLRSVE